MAVTVYFWQPHIAGGEFNFGHAAVKIDGGSPPGDVYFSVWAKGEIHFFWGPGAMMSYHDDMRLEQTSPHTARLTRLNETAMKEWIKKQDLHYSPFFQNCAANAAMCLRAGTAFSNWPNFIALTRVSINTPWALWLWVHNELLPGYR